MFLLNGEPLQRDGVYAALQRQGAEGDIRSNISAGGSATEAVIGERELEIAEMVRPQLIQDGMFMVGLDIAGGILLEVNVFSPGGIGGIKEMTGVDFAPDVIDAVERKVLARKRYTQHFANVTLATM